MICYKKLRSMWGIQMKYKINADVWYDGKEFHKRQMNLLVKKASDVLEKYEIQEGELVLIRMKRSPELLAVLFAALQKKITFCLIDPDSPRERTEEAFEYASLYVTQDARGQMDYQKMHHTPEHDVFTDVAYLLYTSGTTGKPKGVMVTRGGLDNFIRAIPKVIPVRRGGTIASFTNCTFDIFLLECVLALTKGVNLVLATEAQCLNPRRMQMIFQERQVDLLQMTPSMLNMLHMVDPRWNSLKNTGVILVGGEQFPKDLLTSLQVHTDARIFNMYGPTETTIWCTVAELTTSARVHIGVPILNTRIYILSKDHKKVKPGETGEICIAGDGLAKGYLADKEKTKERFCFLADHPEERIYCTGDLGRINEDNELCCLGREDEQVKIRGHRIELQDIDMNILKADGIRNCMTCYEAVHDRLICFYVADDDGVDPEQLRGELRERVPSYMIPGTWVCVKKLLYTVSGKADRKAMLREWKQEHKGQSFQRGNLQSVKQEILLLIENYCGGGEPFHVEMNLEDAGFDSISFISFVVEIEKKYEIKVDDESLDIHSFQTINELAEYFSGLV